VPDDRRFAATARRAKNVDAGDSTALYRVAGGDHFGIVRVCGREVRKEREVVVISVVRIEPCRIGKATCRG
jgi:hypothetical protein